MNNPRVIEILVEGATYKVPTYKVTNDGIEDGGSIEIVFCKGNKEDETTLRQEGVFTETLIQTAKQYLESVNVGQMATRETSMVITKLDEALMWIAKRAEDRKLRGVQGTYQKQQQWLTLILNEQCRQTQRRLTNTWPGLSPKHRRNGGVLTLMSSWIWLEVGNQKQQPNTLQVFRKIGIS